MNNTYTAIIIEGNQYNISLLINITENIKLLGVSKNLTDAYKLYTKQKPQIVFLDISLGSNKTTTKLINKFKSDDIELVLVTTNKLFAIQDLKIKPTHYLLKPIVTKKFIEIISQIGQSIDSKVLESNKTLKLNTKIEKNNQSKVEFINHIKNDLSLVNLFSEKEWLALKNRITVKHIAKGDYFIKEGDYCNAIAYINRGVFNSYYLIDGYEHISHFFFKNEFMLNYPRYILKEKSKLSIKALKNATITIIKRNDILKLHEQFAKFQEIETKLAEKSFLTIADKHDSFLTQTPEELYLELITNKPEAIKQIPLYMIASYIGVTPETLSRIRKRFHNK